MILQVQNDFLRALMQGLQQSQGFLNQFVQREQTKQNIKLLREQEKQQDALTQANIAELSQGAQQGTLTQGGQQDLSAIARQAGDATSGPIIQEQRLVARRGAEEQRAAAKAERISARQLRQAEQRRAQLQAEATTSARKAGQAAGLAGPELEAYVDIQASTLDANAKLMLVAEKFPELGETEVDRLREQVLRGELRAQSELSLIRQDDLAEALRNNEIRARLEQLAAAQGTTVQELQAEARLDAVIGSALLKLSAEQFADPFVFDAFVRKTAGALNTTEERVTASIFPLASVEERNTVASGDSDAILQLAAQRVQRRIMAQRGITERDLSDPKQEELVRELQEDVQLGIGPEFRVLELATKIQAVDEIISQGRTPAVPPTDIDVQKIVEEAQAAQAEAQRPLRDVAPEALTPQEIERELAALEEDIKQVRDDKKAIDETLRKEGEGAPRSTPERERLVTELGELVGRRRQVREQRTAKRTRASISPELRVP